MMPAVGNQRLQHWLSAGRNPIPIIQRKCESCSKREEVLAPIQTKLTINQPGDVYEREAEHMADAVMRMPDPANAEDLRSPAAPAPIVQRMCSECKHDLQRKPAVVQRLCPKCEAQANIDPEPELNLQSKEMPGRAPEVSEKAAARIEQLRASGESLPNSERGFFESRLGYDFSAVRVHADSRSAESAREVGALAYTTGRDIVFGTGQYHPGSAGGRHLIAHELVHVMQQNGGHGARAPGVTRLASQVTSPVQRMGDPEKAPKSIPCRIANTSSITPVLTSVMFDKSSAALSPAAIAELSAIAAEWNAVPFRTARVRIDGFASTDGPQDVNWTLSCNRANQVATELETPSGGGAGIPSGFLDIFAQGETDEFAATPEPNRRVTISASLPVPVIPAAGCANPGDARDLDLQPVFLRTGPGDPSPTGNSWGRRFNSATSIWGKLGVSFHALGPVTLDTPLKTSAAANVADWTAVAALRSGPGVEVFFMDNDVAAWGGAASNRSGCEPNGKIVISDRGSSETLLAHELGHIMGLGHPSDPPASNPGDVNTVMEPTNSPSTPNPTRNTMGNFGKILCPPGTATTCLHPDP